MGRRGTARAEAVRRAHEAASQRDLERRLQEERIEAALADYYQATGEAERIRSAARRKAEGITSAAEQAAAGSVVAARDAVRRLRDLLGGNAEVAELCGITTVKVREYLAARPGTGADPAAAAPGEPAAVGPAAGDGAGDACPGGSTGPGAAGVAAAEGGDGNAA
jgi:hypothetical protein